MHIYMSKRRTIVVFDDIIILSSKECVFPRSLRSLVISIYWFHGTGPARFQNKVISGSSVTISFRYLTGLQCILMMK